MRLIKCFFITLGKNIRMFIHESKNWPTFRWDNDRINALQLDAIHRLGYLAGRLSNIGFESQLQTNVEAVTMDVVASWAIEGIALNTDQVRSSVARFLGVSIPKATDTSHYVEGIVEMMLDATRNNGKPLTEERLFSWHQSLFPTATDMHVGGYRTEEMSVVSGTFGRERVHYRAPEPNRVQKEMGIFLDWLKAENGCGPLIKSGIAHLWFVSIHPFDDGNGRIARAISDMILASLDPQALHYYSLSSQILKDKNHYYKVLERTTRGDGEISEWLEWYCNAFIAAVESSSQVLSQVLRKATFWQTYAGIIMTERQKMVLNKYLDGYDGKLTVKNWGRLADVSRDTAARDIEALVGKGVLTPTPGRVRDIPYSINYTPQPKVSPFSELKIKSEGDIFYITATIDGGVELRDRINIVDIKRLTDQEISLEDLAYKYFAYYISE